MGTRADAVAATRERIARATLRLLLEQPYEDVTLAEIALGAEVSHQTVLNHYESKEGAALAAIELLRAETEGLRTSVRRSDPKHAVEVLVEQYEQFGDLNVRWAMSAERLGRLAVLLDHARAAHRNWLEEVFAARLPAAPAARRRAVNALHAATDVYTWKLLRRDLNLSRPETARTMTALVRGVLDT
ncbi:TetR/AcrR family transcriptional regulator [Frankia sp. CNm7]|uniref:TetR/AcrR family transcriptional regulator n=1 Tax=Frankia nepalensis TaxID=1836974 RepID=A0A937UNC0_9ACTN|nr:TetR/AcrR family transcriptional regulator [Frankia nepalensis]MBL7498809.1 TetR/AcrR family transcriptional regulator [Frankia nepalensis]MBL7508614.1 TetR/AcrR family transcriptional regulator [Frankia nepalensis]MBL7517468.1 TetR/AcrR family transcriptional regulator [Frankia nepalensis]MBL7629714.1 TetR/AcrR family transcriptional regulator [Frankia nepalensis]